MAMEEGCGIRMRDENGVSRIVIVQQEDAPKIILNGKESKTVFSASNQGITKSTTSRGLTHSSSTPLQAPEIGLEEAAMKGDPQKPFDCLLQPAVT